MSDQNFLMPPDEITTRLDGWIGTPDRMPVAIAKLIGHAMPNRGGDTIAEIRARMIARHLEVIGYV